jgi:hypothetical protein
MEEEEESKEQKELTNHIDVLKYRRNGFFVPFRCNFRRQFGDLRYTTKRKTEKITIASSRI